jgi:hypothetical protein
MSFLFIPLIVLAQHVSLSAAVARDNHSTGSVVRATARPVPLFGPPLDQFTCTREELSSTLCERVRMFIVHNIWRQACCALVHVQCFDQPPCPEETLLLTRLPSVTGNDENESRNECCSLPLSNFEDTWTGEKMNRARVEMSTLPTINLDHSIRKSLNKCSR